MSEFDRSLPALALSWRTGNDMTLHQAKYVLRMSIGHISDLENGKVPWTARAFLKYHQVDPERFPLALASQLEIDAPAAAENSGQSSTKGETMKPEDEQQGPDAQSATEPQPETTDASEAGTEESADEVDQAETGEDAAAEAASDEAEASEEEDSESDDAEESPAA